MRGQDDFYFFFFVQRKPNTPKTPTGVTILSGILSAKLTLYPNSKKKKSKSRHREFKSDKLS